MEEGACRAAEPPGERGPGHGQPGDRPSDGPETLGLAAGDRYAERPRVRQRRRRIAAPAGAVIAVAPAAPKRRPGRPAACRQPARRPRTAWPPVTPFPRACPSLCAHAHARTHTCVLRRPPLARTRARSRTHIVPTPRPPSLRGLPTPVLRLDCRHGSRCRVVTGMIPAVVPGSHCRIDLHRFRCRVVTTLEAVVPSKCHGSALPCGGGAAGGASLSTPKTGCKLLCTQKLLWSL